MADGIAADPIPPLTADDAEAKSIDPVAANLQALRALFPDAFTEGKVDFDVLRQLLGDAVDEGEEKYGLTWSGKRRARRLALTPSTGTLLPAPDDSVDWDTTRNLMIEGDNLEVLKLLQKSYAGKVKLIYIDPPYNTGNDFVYPDDYADSLGNYLKRTGQAGESGVKNTSNAESSGRFHTDWLNMIYPRMILARGLLAEDGVLACSIDENELNRFISVGDEVFGEDCLLGVIVAQLNPRGRHLDQFIARTHEYLCVYARDPDNNPTSRIVKDDRMLAEYRKEDSRGKYRELELRNRNPAFNRATRPRLFYPIYIDPSDGTVSVEPTATYTEQALPRNSEGKDSCWTWGLEKLRKERAIVLGRQAPDGSWRVFRKDYALTEDGETATTLPKSLWTDKSLNNDLGKKAVQDLFGGYTPFSFPKSLGLLEQVIEIGGNKNGIVLDFFAGSGTTGHAVMAQNAADGGSRRYILVQLPEPLDPANKDQNVAADFCDTIGKPRTIAELTKERLRRAAKKVATGIPVARFDGGFRVYKLAPSNLKAWNPSADLESDLLAAADNLVDGRTDDDLLVELLLKRGVDLVEPVQARTIVGRAVQAFGGGVLVTCLADVSKVDAEALADGIADWIVELDPAAPAMVIFKDGGFESDVAKANVDAILRQRLNGRAPDPARGGKLPELLLDVRSL